MRKNAHSHDATAVLALARESAAEQQRTIYIVPTYYGLQLEANTAALPSKYVEVDPDGRAWEIAQVWTNDGKVTERSLIR